MDFEHTFKKDDILKVFDPPLRWQMSSFFIFFFDEGFPYLGLSINSFKCQITKMSNISFSFPFHVWRSNVQNLSLGLVAFEMGVAWQLHICTRTFRDDITNLEPLNKLFLISDHWSSTNQLRTISNNHVHHWSVSSWVWRRSGHSSWECNKHLPRAAKTRS